ncbi:hypothetical protein KSP40_PGU003573 [Platanthera guangdongensis]|uniref:Knottins-like domain-containing protein n=1 Tax=Platanthera guangdongensis TaxID=2320717 RepID=A0ABR2M688_9ASPA
MEFSKRNLPTLALVLLLLVSSDVRAEPIVKAGRVCYMKSLIFRWPCLSSRNCAVTCRGEFKSAIDGSCNAARYCICSQVCK